VNCEPKNRSASIGDVLELDHAECTKDDVMQSPKLGANTQTDRRVIFLGGAARSGTTWLATILNTFKGVIYCHEPFRTLGGEKMESLVRKMKSGTLRQDERRMFIDELCKSHPGWHRPPFFPKNDQNWPPAVQNFCWCLVRIASRGDGVFRRLFSPDPIRSYDLLIKEVDWARHLESTIRSLSPDVILIIRHPCGVVASLVKGQRLGVMPREERQSWLRVNEEDCRHLGFRRSSVLAMDEHKFLALNWLLQNLISQRVLESHPRAAFVVYEELCRDPVRITESLFQFLSWPIRPETRQFIELTTGRGHSFLGDLRRANNSYFGVFKKRTRVLHSWKTDLSDQAKEEITSIARLHPGYRNYWPE